MASTLSSNCKLSYGYFESYSDTDSLAENAEDSQID